MTDKSTYTNISFLLYAYIGKCTKSLNPTASASEVEKTVILAKQTGCFAPGCKFNVESTDPPASKARALRAGVLLPFRPVAENSSHPLCGW